MNYKTFIPGKTWNGGFDTTNHLMNGDVGGAIKGFGSNFSMYTGITGVAGALGGAYVGTLGGNDNGVQGAVIGAGIGVGAMPVIGALGAVGFAGAKYAVKHGDDIFNAGEAVAKGVGKAGIGAGKFGFNMMKPKNVNMFKNQGLNNFASRLVSPLERNLGALGKLTNNIVKVTPERVSFDKHNNLKISGNKMRLSGKGKLLGALGLFGAASYNTVSNISDRRGSSIGVQSAAPQMPSYANNGGATGDLVFALNNNRRG